jgi:deoxyhypusine synthase
MAAKKKSLQGAVINPPPLKKEISLKKLVEDYFLAYNAGALRDACRLFVTKMLKNDVTIGMSLAGALTPAGLGRSCIIPFIKNGMVDWIVSTGANLYHDAHFALGLTLHKGSPFLDDKVLKKEGVVRIYDVVMDYRVLLSTDRFFREILSLPEFQKEMGTAEFHYLIGKYLFGREKALGRRESSILSTAYRYSVPVYSPSPGDSSIGMNLAELSLKGKGPWINVSLDVNETASIVYHAKRGKGKSGVFILGGGSPKNFMLQTEPQIQEILGLADSGHDYFIQVTDARPDTGGLSGATPSEAVSWGKVDPTALPNAVVVYLDTTVALPIITAYALSSCEGRRHKRLYQKRGELLEKLKRAYLSK